MPEVVLDEQSAFSRISAYADSWEHLTDELRRLDLSIRLEVLKQRNHRPADPLDQFKGLVLSEEEISELLVDTREPMADKDFSNAGDSIDQATFEALSRLESQIEQRRAASLKQGIYLSLPRISQLFELTSFEEQCLLICLAPELDRKYEKLYAYLQDDVTRKLLTVDLALHLLCHGVQERLSARSAFASQAPLLKYRLLHMVDGSQNGLTPLLSRALKLDDRVAGFLLGDEQIDARLTHVTSVTSCAIEPNQAVAPEKIRDRIQAFAGRHFSKPESERKTIVFYFHGPYGSGKNDVAEIACRSLKRLLLICDVGRMLCSQLPFEETVQLLGREVMLQQSALCLENFDSLVADADKNKYQLESLLEMVQIVSQLTFLLGNRAWKPDRRLLKESIFIPVEFPIPNGRDRKHFWEKSLNKDRQCDSDVDASVLASQFRLTRGQIRDAVLAARNISLWCSPGDGRMTMADLYAGCRIQSGEKLSRLARKIDPKYTWDDIVLPPDPLAQLKELCSQAKLSHVVYGDWGFECKLSYGKGLNALFSGPSGTGKTMAAEIIANELGLDLYKIDLSQVVSKYIGETEKNLDRIFTEAQTGNAILFFDEADALFGRRSEVKDAHDRYANIEIGYLLQKMEEYEGIAILTTNLRQNIDEAFVRRLQVIVEFPFPDEAHRRRIWQVVFPREAPLGEDVDFGILTREIRLAGGNIKNIALTTAFYAAEEGGSIQMSHLMRATRREYQKLGRTWTGD